MAVPPADDEVRRRHAEEILFAWWAAGGAGGTLAFEALLAQYPDLSRELRVERDRLLSALGAPVEPRPETVLDGDYLLLSALARTGMGQVWKARQISLNRDVAVKFLLPEVNWDEDRRKRFDREAEILGAVRLPGIVPVHARGEWQHLPYFVMDWLDGHTLDRLVAACRVSSIESIDEALFLAPLQAPSGICGERPSRDAGAPPVRVTRNYIDRVVRIVRDAARVIHEVHARGVIHRDIKPSNLLLDPQLRIHVLDFGLAFRAKEDTRLTRTGMFPGTAAYMSPEQVSVSSKGESPLDARTDIYSLGVVLYELLTFRLPFAGASSTEIYHRIREETPERLRKGRPWIPRDLEAIVGKAMEKNRNWRYPTAVALADDLDRFLEIRPVRARSTPPARAWKLCRRHPVVAGCACFAILATLLIGHTLYSTHRSRSQAQLKVQARIALEQGRVGEACASLRRLAFEFQDAEALSEMSRLERLLGLGGAASFFTSADPQTVIFGIRSCIQDLQSPTPTVGAEAFEGELLEIIERDDTFPEVKAEAITALGTLGKGTDTVLPILERACSQDPEKREAIEYLCLLAGLRVLGPQARLGDSRAIDLLSRMAPNALEDLEEQMRADHNLQAGNAPSWFEGIRPAAQRKLFECSAFKDEFQGDSLSSAWFTWPGSGEVSVLDGVLRFTLGVQSYAFPDPDRFEEFARSTFVMRRIEGLRWILSAKVFYRLLPHTGRQANLMVYLGHPSLGRDRTTWAMFQRSRDGDQSTLGVTYSSRGETDVLNSRRIPGPDSCVLRIARNYNEIEFSAGTSVDPPAFEALFTVPVPASDLEAEQWLVLTGFSWGNPRGSYADWDWIELEDHRSPRFVTQPGPGVPWVFTDFPDRSSHQAEAAHLGTFRQNWIAAVWKSQDGELIDGMWKSWGHEAVSLSTAGPGGESLDDPSPRTVDEQLSDFLARCNDREVIEDLVRVLVQRKAEGALRAFIRNPNRQVLSEPAMESAVEALGEGTHPESLAVLEDLLRGGTPRLRRAAAQALIRRKHSLTPFWSYASPLVRILESSQDGEVFEPILRLVLDPNPSEIRDSLAALLGHQDDAGLQEVVLDVVDFLPREVCLHKARILEVALASPREDVRLRAARASRGLGRDEGAARFFAACLRDTSRAVRLEAACRFSELEWLDSPLLSEAIVALEEVLTENLEERLAEIDRGDPRWLDIHRSLLALKRLNHASPRVQEAALRLIDSKKYELTALAAEYFASVPPSPDLRPRVVARIHDLLLERIIRLAAVEDYVSLHTDLNECYWYSLALLHLQAPEDAVWIFQKEAQRLPESQGAFMDLARAYSLAGRHDEALWTARKALDLAPQDTSWLFDHPDFNAFRESPQFVQLRTALRPSP